MTRKSLPAARDTTHSDEDRTVSEVWVRISAFLSLKSPETQRTYSGVLGEWCRFLGHPAGTADGAKALVTASDLHAAAYRAWLAKRPGETPRPGRSLGAQSRRTDETPTVARSTAHKAKKKTGLEHTQSGATIHKKFAALRRMYRVLIAHGLIQGVNPFDTDITPPPSKDAGRKRPTEMIEFNLVWQIVTAPDESTSKGIRDRAILALLFGGALRRSELTQLRMTDVRRTPSGTTYLYLRATKAKRDAEQALPPWCVEILDRHITERRAEGASDLDYLFVGYTGQAGKTPSKDVVSDSGIYALFKQYCMQVGAGPYVTPHSARATAITKLLADGIPHREVQSFSRHASIQMVEHYDKRRFDVERSVAKGLSFKPGGPRDKAGS
jgi:integrase